MNAAACTFDRPFAGLTLAELDAEAVRYERDANDPAAHPMARQCALDDLALVYAEYARRADR